LIIESISCGSDEEVRLHAVPANRADTGNHFCKRLPCDVVSQLVSHADAQCLCNAFLDRKPVTITVSKPLALDDLVTGR